MNINPIRALVVVAIVLLFLIALLGAMLFTLTQTVFDLDKRIDVLEKTEHYRGKDADGNEVWAAQVQEIELGDLMKPKEEKK